MSLNQRPLSAAFVHQALLLDLYIQTNRDLPLVRRDFWPRLSQSKHNRERFTACPEIDSFVPTAALLLSCV